MKRKILNIIMFVFVGLSVAGLTVLAVSFFIKPENTHEHSYVWSTVQDANCQHDGIMEGKCSCGDKITKILPQTDHNFVVVDEPAATCEHEGKRMEKCSFCNLVKTGSEQTIPQTGHKWNEGHIELQPDCTNPGRKTCTCEYCHTQQQFTIDALGHDVDEVNWVIDKDPTFFENGSKSHHCKRQGCQFKKDITPIDKLELTNPEVTYNIKLTKTNGENLPTSTTPTIVVKDAAGQEKGRTDGFNYSITLPSNQMFYVTVSNLQAGYTAQESYTLTPDVTDVKIKIPAAPIEFVTETHGRYAIGSVIVDDPIKVLGRNSGEDYETSLGKLLKQYKGLFINTYFNTCPACNAEMPYFKNAYNATSRYGEKYSDEIAVVMINVQDHDDAIRNKKNSENIPMMMAARDVWLSAHFRNISGDYYPTSIWIDCEGVIVGSYTGAIYNFTNYFDILLDRYYTIKGKTRPSDKVQTTASATKIYVVEPKKRRIV